MSHVDPVVDTTELAEQPTENTVEPTDDVSPSEAPIAEASETAAASPSENAAVAAEESTVAAEAPAPTAEDDSNNNKLEELRRLIQQRKDAIAAKKAEVEAATTDATEQEQELWDAKSKHQTASKESADLEKKRAEAEPDFERLNDNVDMRDTAIKLTEDIEQHETELAAEEERATTVESQCKETTSLYADESKRSTEFINAVQQQIEQLHDAFNRKITLTAQIDPEGFEAFDHLQDVSVAVMARGKQLSTLTKILREQQCLLQINASRKESLNSDYEGQIATLLRQKDEQIRDAVFRYQDERAKLHHDIEDMQRINKEQASALKAGDVQKRTDKGTMIGAKSTTSSRAADEQAALNADVETINEKVALAKGDIAAALEGIRNATKVKSDLIKEEKTLLARIQWDKTHQDAEIAGIGQSTQLSIAAKARQEKENEKLAEAIKLLTRQVKRLKEAAETIENRTKPLPVE